MCTVQAGWAGSRGGHAHAPVSAIIAWEMRWKRDRGLLHELHLGAGQLDHITIFKMNAFAN
jgi:hypothetical protein